MWYGFVCNFLYCIYQRQTPTSDYSLARCCNLCNYWSSQTETALLEFNCLRQDSGGGLLNHSNTLTSSFVQVPPFPQYRIWTWEGSMRFISSCQSYKNTVTEFELRCTIRPYSLIIKMRNIIIIVDISMLELYQVKL